MPDRKTQKKSSSQKYNYPASFLTKNGTIRKNMRKKACTFLRL